MRDLDQRKQVTAGVRMGEDVHKVLLRHGQRNQDYLSYRRYQKKAPWIYLV